jgi:hypothetical protein
MATDKVKELPNKWRTEDCDDSQWMGQPVSDGVKKVPSERRSRRRRGLLSNAQNCGIAPMWKAEAVEVRLRLLAKPSASWAISKNPLSGQNLA